jgi:flagellar biosynthetic protein FlhB
VEGKDGRTERATGKKRSEERSKGNVCLSQEVTACCVLVCGVIGVRLMVPQMFESLQVNMKDMFTFNRVGEWSGTLTQSWLVGNCLLMGKILFPVFAAVLVGSVSGNMIQTGPFFHTGALKMRWGACNPVKGMKTFFSLQSIVRLGISLLKICLIVFVAYKVMSKDLAVLITLPQMPGVLSVQWVLGMIFKMTFWILFLFVAIALLDWVFKKRKFEQSIMMTKQEVKDEMKQQEVSPIVKRALAKKMRELSLHRMMAAVPDASVIITNPTHVAIAIKYDPENMGAPRVVAKGLRLVAERIKKIALHNNIPIVERPPLARAIYKSVKVGQEIPSNFYEAVATVLAYLHKIGRGIRMK